jgi:hypothetical protein
MSSVSDTRHLVDDARVIIYDRDMFIIQATDLFPALRSRTL